MSSGSELFFGAKHDRCRYRISYRFSEFFKIKALVSSGSNCIFRTEESIEAAEWNSCASNGKG
jgi:hypothetical protein